MKSYSYSYTPSDQINFQGDWSRLQRYINDGYRIVAGDNGSYVLAKLAYGFIYEMEEGRTIAKKNANNFIRSHYNRSRITEKAYVRLTSDLNAGKVKFKDLY